MGGQLGIIDAALGAIVDAGARWTTSLAPGRAERGSRRPPTGCETAIYRPSKLYRVAFWRRRSFDLGVWYVGTCHGTVHRLHRHVYKPHLLLGRVYLMIKCRPHSHARAAPFFLPGSASCMAAALGLQSVCIYARSRGAKYASLACPTYLNNRFTLCLMIWEE